MIRSVALLILGIQVLATEEKSAPPNVLFIAVDDLNDWVNCLGGRRGVHTPNLDRLAARGVLFTNAHCAAPSCNPSRVAMMTGVAPSSSGIYHNGQDWRKSPRLEKAVTIPEHLRAHGYHAAGAGKIFHALSWIKGGYGKQQNEAGLWDDYWPEATNPMPAALWPRAASAVKNEKGYVNWKPIARGREPKGRPSHFFDWAPIDQPGEGMADAKVVDWAAGELARERNKPFFLAVGIYRPHIPWFVPRKWFDLYPLKDVFLPRVREGDLDDCPPSAKRGLRRSWHRWLLDNDEWRNAVRGYLASISFADAQVGRLLDALDASPHAKNTAIVLWSDHGMHIGEKEHWEKFTLWEESTRVPLMIVAPGVTKGGGRCARPVSLLDVYPTLAELCGTGKHGGLDGRSLLPLLRDRSAAWDRRAVTTWGRNNHAVRGDRYRYVRRSDGSEELYDHESDPDEFNNLAGRKESGEVIRRLSAHVPGVNAERVK